MKHVLSVLSNQQRETDVKLTVMREAAYGGWRDSNLPERKQIAYENTEVNTEEMPHRNPPL